MLHTLHTCNTISSDYIFKSISSFTVPTVGLHILKEPDVGNANNVVLPETDRISI